jgi:glucan phosphoethanolaminetransferase (alkaline phosphatase superfamily)
MAMRVGRAGNFMNFINHKWRQLTPGFRTFLSLVFLFLLSVFFLSIADTGWRKGAYKCLQSVFLLMALFSIFARPKLKFIIKLILSYNIANFLYYSFVFGRVDAGTILSLLETNSSETWEFIKTLDSLIVAKSFALTVLFWKLCSISLNAIEEYQPKKYKLILPFFVAYLAFVGGKLIKTKENHLEILRERTVKFLEQDVYTHFIAAYGRYQLIMDKYDVDVTPNWGEVTNTQEPKKDIYFLVIGESARRDAYGFYNEKYDTTPKLVETTNITIVKDAISPGVQTRESVVRILSLNDKEKVQFGNNIISLANKAGFSTYWVSNQSKVGENDTTIVSIAKQSQKTYFLNNGHYRNSGTDNKLLPIFREILKKETKGPKLVILHTMGSHNSFCARVWKKKNISNIDSKDQCYFNSIENSHTLNKELISILRQNNLSFSGIFLSDHALVRSKKSPYFVHGAGKQYTDEAVKVPLIFFNDSPVENKVLDKRYFLRDFIHTFAHWSGIKNTLLSLDKSILNSEFKVQENYILRSNFKQEAIQ